MNLFEFVCVVPKRSVAKWAWIKDRYQIQIKTSLIFFMKYNLGGR